jgi:hypothetical protein
MKMAAVSVSNPQLVVGNYQINTSKWYSSLVMSQGNNLHEELSINIISPPKPSGMNDSKPPPSQTNDTNLGRKNDLGPQKNSSTTTGLPQRSPFSSSSETTGIELKTLFDKEDDLASSKLPFVWKLYEMLEDVEANGQEDIVSWIDEGRGFKVHSMQTFANDIIPKYFRQSKYKSFQRQLYFYDFQRVTSGPDVGGYKHPKFMKGVKTLCLSMMPKKNARRRSSKCNKANVEIVRKEEEAREGAESAKSDHSEWVTQMKSLMIDGADYGQVVPSPERRPSDVLSQYEDFEPPAILQREGPSDGDTVVLFGGQPFHFVDVGFDDLYPPSISESSTGHRHGSYS